MTKNKQIYKCGICGNVVEILHEGSDTLVCCKKPMRLLQEQNDEHGLEKHVPIVKQNGQTVIVTVGSTTHPMEDSHYIEWVELIVDGEILRKHFTPTDKAEVKFLITRPSLEIRARAYCNVHGLWRS
ncbi:desulfoferrodoxin [bacterium]|nr:desulfoferrodoxin [bacterium]